MKNNILLCEDSSAVMNRMENESVDLILTDPPYGIDYQNNYTKEKHEKITGDRGINYKRFAEECFRILKPNAHAYFFTRFDKYPEHYSALREAGFKVKNCLIVEKGNTGGCGNLKSSYANNAEWIIFCSKGEKAFEKTTLLKNKKAGLITNCRGNEIAKYKTRFPTCWFGGELPKSTYNSNWQKKNNIKHPTVKNVEFLKWIIQISSKENEIVFDPFGGSGSTFVAAIETRRKFIGSEIIKEFCEMSLKRIEESKIKMRETEAQNGKSENIPN